MSDIITVEDVHAHYNGKTALDGISLHVDRGHSFALLGPNGAGKTTLINILCTLRPPQKGRALVAGHDVVRASRQARRAIGVVFQTSSLDDRLTAYENLEFHGLVHGLSGQQRRKAIAEVLELVSLTEWEDEIVRTFSGGMKRRLEIARALMHNPKILFLDEPTVGLDAQTRQQIWYYLDQLRSERKLTILTTTHYIEEVEGADVACIIDHGQIIAQDTPDNLKAQYGRRWLQADALDINAQRDLLARYPDAHPIGGKSVAIPASSVEISDLQTGAFSGRIQAIHYREPTLESVFLSLTGRDLRDRANGEREAEHAEGTRGGRA